MDGPPHQAPAARRASVVRAALLPTGVAWALLALVAAALFSILAFLLVGVLAPLVPVPSAALWAAAGFLAAALLLPAHRLLVGRLDRAVFGGRATHDEALLALERDLGAASGPGEVAGLLRAFLAAALSPGASSVVLRDGGDWRAIGDVPEVAAKHAAAQRDGVKGGAGDVPPDVTEGGIRLVEPVAASGRLFGVLLLGEKAAGRDYGAEDRRVLAAAASRAAVALERMDLLEHVGKSSMARRELVDLNRQKSDFLARVAHDLRTPLAAVRWSVQNVLDGITGPPTPAQREYLDAVQASVAQLARLVENLLEASRIDLGAPRPPPAAVDLGAVAADAIAALRPLAMAKSVRIDLARDEGVAPVSGERNALLQVAMNLLDNAIQHAPERSAVDVEVRAAPGGAPSLVVRDRGPGLPATGSERLFDLFAQGEPAPRAGLPGLGVGLYVVKSNVERFGGTVLAENHPEGGARFECRLVRFAGPEAAP